MIIQISHSWVEGGHQQTSVKGRKATQILLTILDQLPFVARKAPWSIYRQMAKAAFQMQDQFVNSSGLEK